MGRTFRGCELAAVCVFVASEPLGHLGDLLLLLGRAGGGRSAGAGCRPRRVCRRRSCIACSWRRGSRAPRTGAAPASSAPGGGRLLRSRCSAAVRPGRCGRSGRARRDGAVASVPSSTCDHSFEDRAQLEAFRCCDELWTPRRGPFVASFAFPGPPTAVSGGGPRLGTAPFSCSRTSSDDDPADKLGDGAAQLVSDERLERLPGRRGRRGHASESTTLCSRPQTTVSSKTRDWRGGPLVD
jgi:hypothetical protein